MKKFMLALAAMVFWANGIVVSAQQEMPITLSATEVEVNQETGEFQFDIVTGASDAYAGMEFGIVCGPECQIVSVEYDRKISSTGPVESDMTWFGFFDGEDSFAESMTITVSGKCQTGVDVSATQVSTGDAEAQVATVAVVDETKAPEQLNVHVGNDASSQVNVTYTTVADTDTVIKLNKVGDEANVIYVEGTSYAGISGKYIHEIAVSGLEPYTEYEYTVGDGFNSANGTFKTALAKNDNQTLKLRAALIT